MALPRAFGPKIKQKVIKEYKFLRPKQTPIVKRKILIYDVESKKDESQEAGFSRPFIVGFDHGENPGDCYTSFRNKISKSRLTTSKWDRRHIVKGGCIDLFMKYVLGYYSRRNSETEVNIKRFQDDKVWIGGHNAGRFDVLFIIPWLLMHSGIYGSEVTTIGSRTRMLKIWMNDLGKKGGCWTFIDTICLVPLSLDKMGKTFCPKEVSSNERSGQKMKFDLNTHEEDPLWETYNSQDCYVTRLCINKFTELVYSLGGDIGITAASTSMKLFTRKYLDNWISRNAHFKNCKDQCTRVGCKHVLCEKRCRGCLHDFVRVGYYGGRSEPHQMFCSRYYYYDLNSSYPFSMLSPMPTGDIIHQGKIPEKSCKVYGKKYIGFVKATVEIPNTCNIPPLPHRSLKNQKLTFPVGIFSGVWDWEELSLIYHPMVNGKIIKIENSVWFKSSLIFNEMVLKLYSFREKHNDSCDDDKCKGCREDYDEGLAFVAKLVLNSLYGKFGMREERSSLQFCSKNGIQFISEKATPKYANPFEDVVWEVPNLCRAPYIIPQISAHIAALSRINLWKAMMTVISIGGEVIYVDTDSLLITKKLPNKMVHPSALGFWKSENPGFMLQGEFVLPKLYRQIAHKLFCEDLECKGCMMQFHLRSCKGKGCPGCSVSDQKMKGLPHKMQTSENFDAMIKGETIIFEQLTMMRTMLCKSSTEMMPGPKMKSNKRTIRSVYDKRVMIEDGSGRTRPIVLGHS